MGSLLTGAWWPGLAALFNNATWALMKFIIWFSEWAATWPSSHFNAAAPSFAFCAFYYAAIIMLVTGWIFRARHKWIVTGAMFAVAAGLIIHWAIARRTIHLHVLPLGGAPAIFVDSSTSQKNLLVDCGDANSAGLILKPFLASQGVNRLPSLCLAVGLLPYFDGTKTILSNFAVNQIFISDAPSRSEAYRELIEKFRHTSLHDGKNVGAWSVLHPGTNDAFTRADDNSVVLRGECNGHSVLVLPALGRNGQDSLMRLHPDLRAEIVIAGLPTSDEPLCDPLLDLLQARLIIVADAEFPATRRASPKLRGRLARRSARVFYCRDNGALTLDISRKVYAVHTATGEPPK
jgi:beta-lactamase superfamily II metal-dependent hydrolase